MAQRFPATDYRNLLARRVHNAGDVCNSPRNGIITDLRVDRWGTFAVILWDEDDYQGWTRDGSPTTCSEAVSVIEAHSIKAHGTRFARFTLLDQTEI